jgi:hypothetical protein
MSCNRGIFAWRARSWRTWSPGAPSVTRRMDEADGATAKSTAAALAHGDGRSGSPCWARGDGGPRAHVGESVAPGGHRPRGGRRRGAAPGQTFRRRGTRCPRPRRLERTTPASASPRRKVRYRYRLEG